MKLYWCHTCSIQFEDHFLEDEEPVWETCNGVFIEEVENETEEEHPRNFVPYTPPAPEPTPVQNHFGMNNVSFAFNPGSGAQAIRIINSSRGQGGANAHGGMVGNLMSMINNLLNGGGELYEGGQTFDQILQQIVANDPNRYGPPPASKEALEKLPKGTYQDFFPKNEESKDDKQEKEKEDNTHCGVWYDEFSYDDDQELIKLPCGHMYHTECLKPWLDKHNTCPTCRHELPTDDIDYENNKLNSQNPNYMRDLLRQANDGGEGSRESEPEPQEPAPSEPENSRPRYHF